MSFLGFIVKQGQLSPDSAKVQDVNLEPPSTLKQLQQFLDFANFYRHFIRDYSKVAAPLMTLNLTLRAFAWNNVTEVTFARLRVLFTTPLVLSHPAHQFTMEVDVSDNGVSAVLSQWNPTDQKLHPCAFISRRLSPAEQNYDAGNRELALHETHHWLEGSAEPFVVWTDHRNPQYQLCSRTKL